ncbi:MAG: alanine racemase [Patescibacteria group bacterium]|nr:alanine racemase [Patescibacteria group bacterium]
MINYLRQLLKPKYPTLNRLEIDSEAILHNLNFLQTQQPQAAMIPVLKSNAYGHGLKEICSILNKSAVKTVAIDSFPEAQIVYRYFRGKVLLIGEMPPAAYRHLNWSRTEVCVYNGETLKAIATLGIKARIHLFVNSGMNREGIKNLPVFWKEYNDCFSQVEIVGLCSHLLEAEGNGDSNRLQEAKFFQDLEFLHQESCYPALVHLGNSAGVFALSDKRLSAFRPGLAIYGYNPFSPESPHYQRAQNLRPALRLITTIVSIQSLSGGETVSYNASYRAARDTKIAVIPFGYYEGLDRRLSNLASFQLLCGDKKISVKLAGRVCMNLSCLDVGGGEEASVGAEVVLVSPHRQDFNSLENLARLQGSIPYELLVKFQANIRKIIV